MDHMGDATFFGIVASLQPAALTKTIIRTSINLDDTQLFLVYMKKALIMTRTFQVIKLTKYKDGANCQSEIKVYCVIINNILSYQMIPLAHKF